MRRTYRIAALGFSLSLLLSSAVSACSDDSSTGATGSSSGSSGGSQTSSASCADVCAAVTKQCGATPPNCESTCGGFTETQKTCIVGASSCAAVDACGSSGASDGGSSSGSTGNDPCAKCTASQFCVTASSVASEIGCFDPPATCNGSSSSVCPCLLSAGTGPCSKGGKDCSEGLANRISCL